MRGGRKRTARGGPGSQTGFSMRKQDLQELLSVLRPVVRKGCLVLADAIEEMGEQTVRRTLALMKTDPARSFIWERINGVRAWDLYEAGGELDAERAEAAVVPELSTLAPDRLVAILRDFACSASMRLRPGPVPWRVFLEASGNPEGVVDILPGGERPEDFMVRVILTGNTGVCARLASDELIEKVWRETTSEAIWRWVDVNSHRIPSDHPAFMQVVEKPVLGLPGVYVVRKPPIPFSPFIHVSNYTGVVASTVFETMEEFEECERYYQSPGVFVLEKPPFYRNSPPCAERPAQLTGGIVEGNVRMIAVPWAGGRVVSVFAAPSVLVAELSAKVREHLHREHYFIGVSKDFESARGELREVFGADMKFVQVRVAGSLHPKL